MQNAGAGAPESVNGRPAEDETKYPEPGMFGVTPAHGFYLRHIKLLELSRIEVQLAAPDRAHLSTSTTFTARTSSPSPPPTIPPAFSVNNSTDVRILISRAAPDSITP